MQTKMLERSQQNLQSLLDSVPDSVFLLKKTKEPTPHKQSSYAEEHISTGEVGAEHYELLYCNKQVDKIFGLPLNGRTPEDLIEVQSLLLD